VGQDVEPEDDIVAFVQGAISSVCALELLLLLRRERQRSLTLDQVVRELRSSELAITQAFDHLTASGLIEKAEQGYRYQQSSVQLDAVCDRLGSLYARKPVKIINAILKAPDEKLRTFANAFRLSGKDQ
jgi:DNA-binding IclR family transcriptional regulator